MKEEFEIIISKDGKLKMTARGFKGKRCEKPLAELKQLIAPESPIIEEGKTWEYYQVEVEATDTLKLSGAPDEEKPKK